MSGHRCPKCNGGIKRTHNEFIRLVKELFDDEYEILGKYKNSQTKILIKHNCSECNFSIFEISPNKFLQGQGCPVCNQSKGERKIEKYLKQNNINFKRQYRFNGCKYKRTLPFDFYIENLNTAIEYDGEFHYKEMTIGNDLQLQQKRDMIKDNYCITNNIKLIRIPY